MSPLVAILRWLPPLRRHRVVAGLIGLMPSLRIATFAFNGTAVITADVGDPEVRQVLLTRSFEPEFFRVAVPFVRPGTATIDVGANAGFCTFGLMNMIAPGSGVSFHVFEANHYLCDLMHRSATRHEDRCVRINHACVSDVDGTSRLCIPDGHWGGSYVTTDAVGAPVPNAVLDEYLEGEGWPPVSLVKMDVEGYEEHALRGLQESLRRGTIDALYVEVSAANLRRHGSTPERVLDLMRRAGCEWYWCKDADLARQRGNCRDVWPRPGGPPVTVARVEEFPPDYQTDLLAIPRNGAFAHLVES